MARSKPAALPLGDTPIKNSAAQYEEMLVTSEPSVNNQDDIENGWGAEI
jgi:hypothetical protein